MVCRLIADYHGREYHHQGPASTRYSTRTRNFLSYSNSTRTKHYSDRVASSKTPRISTIIQKQPARRYFRIITANPDIQMQPSMEKMSSDLNVKKMEDVSKLYFKNYMTHKFISSHAHALQQPQVCLDDDQILHLCRFSIFKDCQKIRSEWASTMRRTLSLSFKSWEGSLLALNPLLFFIQHFPFLSDIMKKHNSRANF